MGAGSANVYAATKQLGGPPVACVYGGGRLSTGHQPGSLICDIDRTAPQALGRTTAGDRWVLRLHLHSELLADKGCSRPTQSNLTDANLDRNNSAASHCAW